MKKFYFTLFMLAFTAYAFAQSFVSTAPENKKVLLEEFTGTGCPNCPGGHTAAATLLTNNPGNLFVVAYHPNNSSYTTSDPMADAYPAAFYTAPFISPTGNRFMPSAMINRRVWGGVERIQGTGSWTSDANTIKGESSPLNVGVSSSYNSTTHILSVTVEVYFTSDVTDALTIYAELTEDGIIAAQSGGTSPYTHNHVFRESFVAQWGDAIPTPTTQGTLKTITFSYNNTSTNYPMDKCEVLAFVRNAVNEEVISANGAAVGSASIIATNDLFAGSLSVFPNPVKENTCLNLMLPESEEVSYSIVNMTGQIISATNLGELSAGSHTILLDHLAQLPVGIYMANVNVGQHSLIRKLIVE